MADLTDESTGESPAGPTDGVRPRSLTPEQLRAARAMLGIPREALAEWAEVSLRTISDFEGGIREPRRSTLRSLQSALEDRGVRFTFGPGDAVGVAMSVPRVVKETSASQD